MLALPRKPLCFVTGEEGQIIEAATTGPLGVLVAQGSKHADYMLYVDVKGHLVFETHMVPWNERMISGERLPEGPLKARYVWTMRARPFEGSCAVDLRDPRQWEL